MALNAAIIYLEALLLFVFIIVYGVDEVLLDIRFMFKQHPKGILVYLKYSWIASLILIVLLITLKFVFLPIGYIGEIFIVAVIFLPFFIVAIYNSIKYTMQKVKTQTNVR